MQSSHPGFRPLFKTPVLGAWSSSQPLYKPMGSENRKFNARTHYESAKPHCGLVRDP